MKPMNFVSNLVSALGETAGRGLRLLRRAADPRMHRRFWALLLALIVPGAPLHVAAQSTAQGVPPPDLMTITVAGPPIEGPIPPREEVLTLEQLLQLHGSGIVVTSCADYQAVARRTFFPFKAIHPACDPLPPGMEIPPHADELEQFARDAIARYLVSRGISPRSGEIDRVIEFKRDVARAVVYTALLEAITIQPRDPAEQMVVNWFQTEVHKRKVLAARFALDEYLRWEVEQCGYRPPPGLSYNPGLTCGNRLTGLFGGSNPPIPNFAQFGAARAYYSSTTASTNRTQVAVAGVLTAGATVAAGLGLGLSAFGVTTTVSTALAAAVFPFSAVATSTTPIYAFAVVGSVAFPVAAALFAIAAAVSAGLDLFERSQLRSRLDQAIQKAIDAPPDLVAMAQDEDQHGVLFLTFIENVSFAGPDPVGEVLPSAWGGSGWTALNTGAILQEIQYKHWSGTNWRAALNNGLFAHAQGNAPAGHMDFEIQYVDSSNVHWTAVFASGAFTVFDRNGVLTFRTDTLEVINHAGQPVRVKLNAAQPQPGLTQPLFLHTPAGATTGHVDSRIDYQTWDGSNWRAFLFVADTSFGFLHVPASGGGFHKDVKINFKGWDNQNYQAVAYKNKVFGVVLPTGKAEFRSQLNYRTHAPAGMLGALWSAQIQ
jgi:hypothetical protein